MSAQYGSWNFARRAAAETDLSRVRSLLAPYGPDGGNAFHCDGADILFYSLREAPQAETEKQPLDDGNGNILVWDGRLDNREELISALSGDISRSASDVAIVAAAHSRWGLDCLRKLIGDWALSIWQPARQQLILAKDFLGTRPLFYAVDEDRAEWCTILDPLVLLAGHSFSLDREYIAGWFGLFPASHLTPYTGIHSVPPASYVQIREDSIAVGEFWQFSPGKRVTYATDAEYEEHFRELFGQAVRRRLRSGFPVLAELSGGMDSSSIVCMADQILQNEDSPAAHLDTISYYSSGEPNWDELPYVAKVEEQRGRKGFHLEVQTDDIFRPDFTPGDFMATPGALCPAGGSDLRFRKILGAGGYRLLLSGIGGDEVLGGITNPSPLLADLLAAGRWKRLGRELLTWSLSQRRPLVSILFETVAMFFSERHALNVAPPPAWLSRHFVQANANALRGYPRRMRFSGPPPSFEDNLHTLEALRRQLSCYPPPTGPAYQKLYPYLDRDLLEFLFAIPQEQLFRPHQRRSLMRRALSGIVPRELLDRKRKAFVIRGPLMALGSQSRTLEARALNMLSASLGIVIPERLVAALREARAGGPVAVTPIVRTFSVERWLENVAGWRVLRDTAPYAESGTSAPGEALPERQAEQVLTAERKQKKGGEQNEIRKA